MILLTLKMNLVHKFMFSLLLYYCNYAADFDVSNIPFPKILSETKDVILMANTNYTIGCHGKYPLIWDIPKIKNISSPWTSTSTTTKKSIIGNEVVHTTYLSIFNVTYPWIGFYICKYKNFHGQDYISQKSSYIYIYIDDPIHLSMYTTRRIVVNKTASEYNIYVPCKPTIPSVQVMLKCSNRYQETITCKKQLITRFDPKFGYELEYSDSLYYLKCVYVRNNNSIVDFVVLKESNYIRDIRAPPPKILIENSTLILKTNTNYSFVCEGKKPVKWILPNVTLIEKLWTKAIITSTRFIQDNDITYRNQLLIQNATYYWTGFYSCQYNENWLNARGEQYQVNKSSVQLYFYDTKHLSVSTSRSILIDITSERPIILPCRPTSPYVNVTLYCMELNGIVTICENKSKHFNPMVGYYLENISHKYYQCLYSNGNRTVQDIVVLGEHDGIEIRTNYYEPKQNCQSCVKTVCIEPILNQSSVSFFWLMPNYAGLLNISMIAKINDAELLKLDSNADKSIYFSCVNNEKKVSLFRIATDEQNCGRYTLLYDNGDSVKYADVEMKLIEENITSDENPLYSRSHLYHESDGNTIIRLNWRFAFMHQVPKINWYDHKNRIISSSSDKYDIITNEYGTEMKLHKATMTDSGRYRVQRFLPSTNQTHDFYVSIFEKPTVVIMVDEEQNSNSSVNIFKCVVKGNPLSKIDWYFTQFSCSDNVLCISEKISAIRTNRLNLFEQESYIRSTGITSGILVCKATNYYYGEIIHRIPFSTEDPSTETYILIAVSVISAIFIIFAIIVRYYFPTIWEANKLQRELTQIFTSTHQSNELICEDSRKEQSNQLNNNSWNFSKKQFKLHERLACGTYSVITLAEIPSLFPKGHRRVAIKTPRTTSNKKGAKMLIKELKTLIHIGSHINIVHVLGACTENISRNELYIIYEYCAFGDLQKFLQVNSKNFLNLIDPCTKMVTRQWAGGALGMEGPEEIAYEKTNVQISVNNNESEFNTKHLFQWSYQVVCGMNFLSNKNIIHCDLAARNILLYSYDLVKICDFGLSRHVNDNHLYKTDQHELLPMKWLAIEVLQTDRIFKESDIWSFGIVLWEIFSLGTMPYPGMAVDESFFHKLANGYRMESPKYATKDIYQVMLSCWNSIPIERPTFKMLFEILYKALDEFESLFFGEEDFLENNYEYLSFKEQSSKN